MSGDILEGTEDKESGDNLKSTDRGRLASGDDQGRILIGFEVRSPRFDKGFDDRYNLERRKMVWEFGNNLEESGDNLDGTDEGLEGVGEDIGVS